MRKKLFSLGLGTLLFALCGPTGAQQPVKAPTIGLLVGGSASSDAVRIEAFRQGLRELGYVDAKNIAVEYRYGEGKPDRLTELATGLVRLPVIVTAGPTATNAAKKATNTILSSWPTTPIPWARGLSRALRGRAGTLLDCPTLRQR